MSGKKELLTKNQALVLQVLAKAGEPLSAYAILDQVYGKGMRAPPQIYRALEKLQAMRLVHRLETLNAFIACNQADCKAANIVAFAICQMCGQVKEFTAKHLTDDVAAWAKQDRFKLKQATIELRGLCNKCE